MSESKAACKLCGEPMPPGEEVFKYHGYSGPCPKPPLPEPPIEQVRAELKAAGIDTGPAVERVLLAVAVSRLRNPHPAEAYPGPCEMHEQPAQRSADMARVVMAYLAEHPADDEEIVSTEWLLSVGFALTGQPSDHAQISRVVEEPVRETYTLMTWQPQRALDRSWVFQRFSGDVSGVVLPELTTRGHVRRLCRALGVELKEFA